MKKFFLCLIFYFLVCKCRGRISPCDEIGNEFACIQFLQRSILDMQNQLNAHANQLEVQSLQLRSQTSQLEDHSERLNNLPNFPDLNDLIVQVDKNSAEIGSHAVKLSILADNSTAQGNQLADFSTELKVLYTDVENHSVQLTNQSSQLSSQSTQLTLHSTQLSNHSVWLVNHSDRLNNLPTLPDFIDLIVQVDKNSDGIESQAVKLNILADNSTAQGYKLDEFLSELNVLNVDVENHSAQLTNQSSQLSSHSTQLTSQSSQLSSQATQLATHASLIQELQNNNSTSTIPIGYIYVQLPQQSTPDTLWPMHRWQDVTDDYAGLFFRALGGKSEPFEQIQDGDSPRLTEVGMSTSHNLDITANVTISPNNQYSSAITTGGHPHQNGVYKLRFKQSNAEVRPRNTAVRIWKRIS